MPPSLPLFLTQLLGPPPEAIGTWWASAERRVFERGQPLLHAGEHWRHLWWVERGALRLYYLDRDGAESNKNFFWTARCAGPSPPHCASSR